MNRHPGQAFRLAVLFFVVGLTIGCSSDSPTGPTISNTSWAPGVSMGPVFLGAAYSSVRAELGAPDSIRYVPGDGDHQNTTHVSYTAPGLNIFVLDSDNDQQLDDGETVNSIVLSDLLSVSSISHSFRYLGLGLGSTHAAVVSTMGRPMFDSTSSSFYVSGVMFSYDATGVVTAIVILKS